MEQERKGISMVNIMYICLFKEEQWVSLSCQLRGFGGQTLHQICVSRLTNEISSLLWFLKTCKHHLSAWDILLRVQEVVVKGLFSPDDGLFLVGLAIGVALGITTCSAKETSKVGAL